MIKTRASIKVNGRAYWMDGDETLGGFVTEITEQNVVVYPDRHDPEAFRLVVPKRDLI
jgi:hypothetical protein